MATHYDDVAVLVARPSIADGPQASRTLPAQDISAGIARGWIADLLTAWRVPGCLGTDAAEGDRRDVAQLLTTELVSNAARFGDQSLTLRVLLLPGLREPERLRIEVADASDRMPVLRRPEVADAEGRGLRLVDTLASAWGVDLEQQGKSVWFELDLTGTAAVDEAKLLAAFGE